jgi:hypothetical protein
MDHGYFRPLRRCPDKLAKIVSLAARQPWCHAPEIGLPAARVSAAFLKVLPQPPGDDRTISGLGSPRRSGCPGVPSEAGFGTSTRPSWSAPLRREQGPIDVRSKPARPGSSDSRLDGGCGIPQMPFRRAASPKYLPLYTGSLGAFSSLVARVRPEGAPRSTMERPAPGSQPPAAIRRRSCPPRQQVHHPGSSHITPTRMASPWSRSRRLPRQWRTPRTPRT